MDSGNAGLSHSRRLRRYLRTDVSGQAANIRPWRRTRAAHRVASTPRMLRRLMRRPPAPVMPADDQVVSKPVPPAAVLLDVDGVLLDSSAAYAQAWSRWASAH